eukprot:CAMPEP_0201585492 /NCGR_PEP_ID=MMETSP0190_2-20130828/122637_1 /ASSEMBLY_ACC=CAM_ASM_000263 /TAXON_ID=37353 /ORGANISM="Rosalina sp." /LENGTH=203 /DNA_ID=CAMNT_0048031543 /DNA_START=23 /DNA_END=630 /DNA_ORIENTATION=+
MNNRYYCTICDKDTNCCNNSNSNNSKSSYHSAPTSSLLIKINNVLNKPLLMIFFILITIPIIPTVKAEKHKNYWDVLGIAKGTSTRNIKKAFRKKATIYHPDKCQLEEDVCHEHFVEINRAYEVLSDDDKRRQYNQYGEEGLKEYEKQQAARGSRRGGGGIFSQFFGGGQQDEDPSERRGEDIEADIWLHLDEIYNGHIYDLS